MVVVEIAVVVVVVVKLWLYYCVIVTQFSYFLLFSSYRIKTPGWTNKIIGKYWSHYKQASHLYWYSQQAAATTDWRIVQIFLWSQIFPQLVLYLCYKSKADHYTWQHYLLSRIILLWRYLPGTASMQAPGHSLTYFLCALLTFYCTDQPEEITNFNKWSYKTYSFGPIF